MEQSIGIAVAVVVWIAFRLALRKWRCGRPVDQPSATCFTFDNGSSHTFTTIGKSCQCGDFDYWASTTESFRND
jgi:hypothetical protein